MKAHIYATLTVLAFVLWMTACVAYPPVFMVTVITIVGVLCLAGLYCMAYDFWRGGGE